MTFGIQEVALALMGVLVALPAAYLASKKRVEAEFTKRLDKISGGRVSTLEDLVAVALTERRLRQETIVSVFGRSEIWSELRRGRFDQAMLVDDAVPGCPGIQGAKVAVVEVRDDAAAEAIIATRAEPYLLIYKEGPPYRGALPPGAMVTYANSPITLDARLLEAIRHMEARR